MATYQDSRYNIALPSGAGGAIVPIKTLTASGDSNLSFVDGSSDVVLDNTYKTYIFKFININPSADEAEFLCNGSADSGSNYNVTKTTYAFRAYHQEDDTSQGVGYVTGEDLAQSSSAFKLAYAVGNAADESNSGEMWLFNPSSTTYVKHFMTRNHFYHGYSSGYSVEHWVGGYFNTTSAIDAVQFSVNSGTFDGTIKLYGIA
tara:strand:+ start:396 stop:1004 length:609 start_codon:yes stop_codon:yes gene_type:complete